MSLLEASEAGPDRGARDRRRRRSISPGSKPWRETAARWLCAEAAREAVRASRRVVDAAVARGDVVYGVNTGFGNFADVHIPTDKLRELQVNLVRSHAAGVGAPLGPAETRALMLLRANVLAKGFSGVRLETLERLVAMLNRRVHPIVPSQGSVGASGDLAPLAHLALALIGEGECDFDGRRLPAAEALAGRRPRAARARAQGRPGPHQRHAAHHRASPGSRSPRPSASSAAPTWSAP